MTKILALVASLLLTSSVFAHTETKKSEHEMEKGKHEMMKGEHEMKKGEHEHHHEKEEMKK